MKFFKVFVIFLISSVLLASSCLKGKKVEIEVNPIIITPPLTPALVEEVVYDETGCLYTSYNKLVMAGYQGWFTAEGDGSDRGWHHYENSACGGFSAECSSIDMWPDMSEYKDKYLSPFTYPDGSSAYLYSPYDEQSVDTHFKWMQEYGIDGVHMQRFIVEIEAGNIKGQNHFNKVLENALKAAKKYDRAISVMYDLSGSDSKGIAYLEEDWNELVTKFKLFDNIENPTYLRHNGKPLMSIWGVGFKERDYSTADVDRLVTKLKGPTNKVSIMLGIPCYWRVFGNDTESNPTLHTLIKKVDVIMPWAVGRYNSLSSYNSDIVFQDIKWAEENGVDYVPLVFPGFTWGNLKRDPGKFNQIPRLKGDFMWAQIVGAQTSGAKSLYVAMFDEVDEGTAIFKVKRENEVPLVKGNKGYKFVGIEKELESDYYLWLTGQAANWFHGDNGYGSAQPTR